MVGGRLLFHECLRPRMARSTFLRWPSQPYPHLCRRAALRRAFHLDPEARVAACGRLGLAPEDLASVGACPNDIAFVERADRILESRSAPARECALDQAVADLDALALSLKAAA